MDEKYLFFEENDFFWQKKNQTIVKILAVSA